VLAVTYLKPRVPRSNPNFSLYRMLAMADVTQIFVGRLTQT
jgi:hypothetical protein